MPYFHDAWTQPVSLRNPVWLLLIGFSFITSASFASESSVLNKAQLAQVEEFCLDCHDADTQKGGLNLDAILTIPVSRNTETWEKVVRKLKARQMPPVGELRPSSNEYESLVSTLVSRLDANAERDFINHMESYLKTPERTLVLSTHKPSMLKLVDRIIVMDRGRVVADGPKTDVVRQLSGGAGRN